MSFCNCGQVATSRCTFSECGQLLHTSRGPHGYRAGGCERILDGKAYCNPHHELVKRQRDERQAAEDRSLLAQIRELSHQVARDLIRRGVEPYRMAQIDSTWKAPTFRKPREINQLVRVTGSGWALTEGVASYDEVGRDETPPLGLIINGEIVRGGPFKALADGTVAIASTAASIPEGVLLQIERTKVWDVHGTQKPTLVEHLEWMLRGEREVLHPRRT